VVAEHLKEERGHAGATPNPALSDEKADDEA